MGKIDYTKRVAEEVEKARVFLSIRDEVREKAIKLSRDIIKYSGWAITEILKGDLEEAAKYMKDLEESAKSFIDLIINYPELYYSGMSYNALSEYVEAVILYKIIKEEDIPGFQELNIPPAPYLQGLGDVGGELRRLALEEVRSENFDKAWYYYSIMESIYLSLRKIDLPEALAPGIRHKADVARRLVDDTKVFLIDLASRKKLAMRLEEMLRSTQYNPKTNSG